MSIHHTCSRPTVLCGTSLLCRPLAQTSELRCLESPCVDLTGFHKSHVNQIALNVLIVFQLPAPRTNLSARAFEERSDLPNDDQNPSLVSPIETLRISCSPKLSQTSMKLSLRCAFRSLNWSTFSQIVGKEAVTKYQKW